MNNFAGIDDKYADYENAAVLLQPVPYDETSTWGKGADKALDAFLEAAENMELYDIETDSEPYRQGICIMDTVTESSSPAAMVSAVYGRTVDMLKSGKFPTFLGGEHSISIGALRAFRENYPNLTVLQLDAHADLRAEYGGTPFSHACAMCETMRESNLVQAGIRSMASSEKKHVNRDRCFFAEEINSGDGWIERSLEQMTEQVYITIDLDVFDPSIMPATGTPEPGGLDWYTVTGYLREVFRHREVVGFDIVELAPMKGYRAPDFMAAKLYYKLLSYRFEYYEDR